MFFILYLLLGVQKGGYILSDLELLEQSIEENLILTMPLNKMEGYIKVEEIYPQSKWGWLVKRKIENILFEKGISVGEYADKMLNFHLDRLKLNYQKIEHFFFKGPSLKRTLVFDLYLELRGEDGELKWFDRIEGTKEDILPWEDKEKVYCEGLSPLDVRRKETPLWKPLFVTVLLGSIMLMIYTGGG